MTYPMQTANGENALLFPKPEVPLVEDQKRILHYLRKNVAVSRVELSHALGINNGVITRYSRELIALGFIEELEQEKPSGRGRPSLPLSLKSDGAYAIGIAVHSGWVDLAVVDFAGHPISQSSFEYEVSDPASFAEEVNGRVNRLTGSLSLFRSRFLGFGVSVPGFAQHKTPSKRHTVERLREWRGVDLGSVFSGVLRGPVWVENDANAAILAEYYNGGLMKSENLILLYLSYGVGGGCISRGQLFRGGFLNAGEIGVMYPLGKPRPSAMDLVDSLNAQNGRNWTLLELRDHSEEAHDLVEAWVDRASDQLFQAALSGMCWFDPGGIAICGTLPNWIVDSIADRLRARPWAEMMGDRPRPEIIASKMGGAAAAVGAGIAPIHETTSPTVAF